MPDAVLRRRHIDRPWRRRLIAFGLAAGAHALVIWLAWPTVGGWMGISQSNARTGPVRTTDLQQAIDAAPIITGFVSAAPGAADVLASEDYASVGWLRPTPALEHARLPYAPQRWLAAAPPVAALSFDRAPARPVPANR